MDSVTEKTNNPKKITMLATGSRGDVQPFVALGYGLRQRGHEICVVSNSHFENWIRRYGLDFRAINWDAQASLQSKDGQGMIAGRILDTFRYITQESPRIYAQVQKDSWLACQDAENLIYSLISPWGYDIAEALGIPGIPGALHPMFPTKVFPTQFFPFNLGGRLNLLTHNIAEWLLWQIMRKPSKLFRRDILDLPPIGLTNTLFTVLRDQKNPLFCAISPRVIAKPLDWPDYIHMTGYWFLDAPPDWHPSSELVEFIQYGLPPVYIGFGSMANRDAKQMTQFVVEALKISGQRGILASGWGGLDVSERSDDIFFLEETPHDWLFPQMAAVVHHGGAGTTAAGLRAGVPSIIIPHMQDQPYWGRRIHELGVGPKPISRKKVTAEKLANAITQAVHDQDIRQCARELGEQIRTETGIAHTIKLIEAYIHGE